MQVTSGTTTSSGQHLSVSLTEDDLTEYQIPWQTMKPHRRHQVLMQYADLMIVQYLLDDGHINSDYARARRESIMRRGQS